MKRISIGIVVAFLLASLLGFGLERASAQRTFQPAWTCQFMETLPGENLWTLLPGPGQVGGVIAIAYREIPEWARPEPQKRQEVCWIQGGYTQ